MQNGLIPLKLLLLKLRRPVAVVQHIGLIVAANTLAFSLRFGGATLPAYSTLWIETLPALVAIRAALFMPFRLYEGLWRYTSISDLRSIGSGVVSSSIAFGLLVATHGIPYPRSIILIDSLAAHEHATF